MQLNVAVKCLRAWNEQAFQQMQMEFIKEANAMSLLDHPHIIRLYGVVLSAPMMLVSFFFLIIFYLFTFFCGLLPCRRKLLGCPSE